MKKAHIPKEILEQVENELLSGEQLLWVGLPKHQHVPADSKAGSKLAAAVLLGIGFMMLSVFAFINGVVADSPWIALGTLIAMFGIILTVAFQGLQSLRGTHKLYAVTNRRALILMKNRVQSFGAKDLQFIERTTHKDGTGDIVFREEHYKRAVPTGYTMTYQNERVTTGFYGVDNPIEVEALMLETFSGDTPDYRHLEVDESDRFQFEADEEIKQARSH